MPSDIELLMGCSQRSSFRHMRKIRIMFNKRPHSFVSLEEFCTYSGFGIETVKTTLPA